MIRIRSVSSSVVRKNHIISPDTIALYCSYREAAVSSMDRTESDMRKL